MAGQAGPERKRDDMFRKRQAPNDYTGRHRIKVTASGGHRRDPLPPPAPGMLGAPVLLSDEPEARSRWHDPSKLRGIDPDLISPVPEIHHEEERPTEKLPPWMEPKRKMQPRYVTAAVATTLIAVPALVMAGWIANENNTSGSTVKNVSSQLAPGTVHMPIVLVVNGQSHKVCITLVNSGPSWTASATGHGC